MGCSDTTPTWKSFLLITDPKPLVTTCAKPLNAAPPRLQHMLMKTQGYDYEVMYRPGTQKVLADTLCWLPNQENQDDIECIDGNEDPELHTVTIINFSSEKQDAQKLPKTSDSMH